MFKNISALIPASSFKQANAYLLHHKNQVLSPVAQFFNPNKDKLNYTPFESSLLALSLSQQVLSLQKMLSQAEGAKFAKFSKEAGEQMKVNAELSAFFIQNCYSMFKQDFDVPVKGYTSFMLASIQQDMADTAFFQAHVLPKIQAKLDYLDKEGLEDLIECMDKLNISDKKLSQKVFEKYEQKQQQYVECTLDAWNLDNYKQESRVTEQDIYVQYFNNLKEGAMLANQRHQLRQIQEVVQSRLINRLFFREARVQQTFNPLPRENPSVMIQQSKTKLLN